MAENEKMTILISSHNLAELEHMCDIIGLINNGRLIEYKTMDQIKAMVQAKQRVQLMCNYPHYAANVLKEKYKLSCTIVGNSILVPIQEKHIATVIAYLNYKKVKIYSIKKIQKTLEELYFDILNNDRPSTSII